MAVGPKSQRPQTDAVDSGGPDAAAHPRGQLTGYLESCGTLQVAVLAGVAAFGAYTCMYAVRKPFTAAGFSTVSPVMIGASVLKYKSLLVIAQVIGYALSKFLGIKFVSEAKRRNRELMILTLIGLAELALLGFAVTSPPWNAVFLFLNGLPLGMIWGLVFAYLEGRRMTEVMGLILCASFILSSALVKDAGIRLLSVPGVTEFSMPFWTGLVFALPLVACVWFLRQLPPPSQQDVAQRTLRRPMSRAERWALFGRFAGGLVVLIVVYTLLTAYRDFRDSFFADILNDLRGPNHGLSFGNIESRVMLGVLPALMLLAFVRRNDWALWANHLVIFGGLATVGISTWLYQRGTLPDIAWLVMTGIGAYLAYIPFNCILFERLLAAFRHVGNVGFLIYVADSFGYLGSVAVVLYKDLWAPQLDWLNFFIRASYALALVGGTGTLVSWAYFYAKHQGWIAGDRATPQE